MNIFEKEEITLEAAQKALSVLDAVARAVGSPQAIEELSKFIVTAMIERQASDEAIALAKAERAEADRRLTRAEEADRHLSDYRERTDREFRQRRQDLDENDAIQNQRHSTLEARETELNRRVAEHERAVGALKTHLGAAA
jgi:hypothetical protein